MPDCSKSPTTFVNLRKILGDLGYEETTDLEANFTLFWTWNQAIFLKKTLISSTDTKLFYLL